VTLLDTYITGRRKKDARRADGRLPERDDVMLVLLTQPGDLPTNSHRDLRRRGIGGAYPV
jgi:hypothetical protein